MQNFDTLRYTVRGQKLTAAPLSPMVVSDTIRYLRAAFSFSKEWEGLSKWAHFTKRDTTYDVQLQDDAIAPEAGLNLSAGVWTVCLHGNAIADGAVQRRITTNTVTLTVEPSGILEGEPFPTVLPSAGEQLIAEAKGYSDRAGASAEAAKVSETNAAASLEALQRGIASGQFKGEKGDKGDKGDKGEVTEEIVVPIVEQYLQEHPVESTVQSVSEDFRVESGVLSLVKETAALQDNTHPITAGAVYKEVGNISALLATI